MKKFSVLIFLSFSVFSNAFAIGETTITARPYSGSLNFFNNCSNCVCNDGVVSCNNNFPEYKLKENIKFKNRIYTIHEYLGNLYINNQPVGNTITKLYRDGILYLNDLPITYYDYNSEDIKVLTDKEANSLFLQSYTKFVLADYSGALDICKKALKVDPFHKKATVLSTILEQIVTGKIKPENVKEVSENSLERIIKMSDSL